MTMGAEEQVNIGKAKTYQVCDSVMAALDNTGKPPTGSRPTGEEKAMQGDTTTSPQKRLCRENGKDIHVHAFLAVLAIALMTSAILLAPDAAFAATIQFTTFLVALQDIVTKLLLPVAIVICAWKMIYIALVGGIMGMDPLNMINDSNNDGQISFSEVKIALMQHVGGFIKGLCWVGGIFIVFRLVLSIAAGIAGVFSDNFA